MSACSTSARRLKRASALVASAAAFTLLAAPAMAQETSDAADGVAIETVYTVKSGDYLAAVADEFGLGTWAVLYAVNEQKIDDPNVILVGQELDIPANPDAVDVDAVDLPAPGGSSDPQGEASSQTADAQPEPQPTSQQTQATQSAAGSVWDRLAQCESGGNWSTNTGNGFSGGLQFHPQTWAAHGGHQYAPSAAQASREQEIAVAERVLASQGWGAWPACASQLGLR